jgi:lipopolysaccharide cholinephosphotransferase
LLANFSGAWGDKEIVPADWYGEGVTLSFEGLEVSAPKEYKKWLQQVYGDYMQLPPEEKRVTHHYTEVIDLDKSYKQYRRG